MVEHPKLFVSYSHDNGQHEEWVKKLSTDLRIHGVDVVLDQWDLRLGKDLRFFMEQGLSEAVLVLCICSDEYVKKFNAGSGGAGYESMILTQELLSNVNSDFIIPIIRNNSGDKKAPLALGSKMYVDFSDDTNYYDKYMELLERIYNEDITKKPPLGTNPFTKEYANSILIKVNTQTVNYQNPELKGTITFDYSNNNHCYTIGSGEYAFVTKWSTCGNNVIHAYSDTVKKIGYIPNCKEMPINVADFEKFDFTSRVRTVYAGEIVVWLNNYGHFAVTKIKKVLARSHGSEKDEITFEYKIYEI